MLVLSRKQGQKIVIGNEIVIEVSSISQEGVRLGITAPGQTSVHRYEVFEEIQEANKAAQNAAAEPSLDALAELIRSKRL